MARERADHMKWKKRANQSLVIALTFALALTMNVPFAAWGAGDTEPVAEVAGQRSDDDRVASTMQPLESQATPPITTRYPKTGTPWSGSRRPARFRRLLLLEKR